MLKSLTCLTAALAFVGSVYAADAVSKPAADLILTADAAVIFNGYWKVQDAQQKLQASEEKANKELKEMYEKGVTIANEVQDLLGKANNPALTEEARKKFEDEAKQKEVVVQQKEVEFNQYQQQVSRTLSQQQEALMKGFADDVKNVTETLRQERGASIVLNAAGPIVITADPKNDVTQVIMDRLNVNKPKATTKTEGTTTATAATPAPASAEKKK